MPSVVQTNVQSQVGLNVLRMTNLRIGNNLQKLATGYKINKAADDPSGLALTAEMTAQIRGLNMAIQNAEDTTNLIQTADAALNETSVIAQRMRDLAVRGANEAVLTEADQLKMAQEFVSLAYEIRRKSEAVTFNTKAILDGAMLRVSLIAFPPFVTNAPAQAQIGADNNGFNRLAVSIPEFNNIQFNFAAGQVRFNDFLRAGEPGGPSDPFNFSILTANQKTSVMTDWIDFTDSVLTMTSNLRANLGNIQNRLEHIIQDMQVHDVNLHATRSRILDTDFAREISDFTNNQILLQSTTAILAQANAQPQSVLQLLQ